MPFPNLNIPDKQLADFCRRWRIKELALFGSALRDDFGPDSDIDVLLTFEPDAHHSSFDLVRLRSELARLSGRPVDVLTRPSVERCGNPWKRHAILSQATTVYAA